MSSEKRSTIIIEKAIIASGETFPDALSASSYAADQGYPILLTRSKSLPESIKKAISDLGVKETYIVGGQNTVAEEVESELPKLVKRLAGKSRYETSIKVAEEFYKVAKKAFLASGELFADALVVGPVAGASKTPIILTSQLELQKDAKDYIQANSFEEITIVGGNKTVSMAIENQVDLRK